MKVMFLGIGAAELRGCGPAMSDPEVVGRDHRVDVVGVLAPVGGVSPGRFLVDDVDRAPSRLVPSTWGADLGRSADAALERLLTKPRVDVVVTLDRAMLAAAVQLCPDGVRVVHRETSTSHRGIEALTAFGGRCDLVLADSSVTARLVREATGEMGVDVRVVPHAVDQGADGSGVGSGGPVILAPQGSGSYEFLERGVRAFAMVASELPRWRLRVLARRADHEVLHRLLDHLAIADRVEVAGAGADQAAEWALAGVGLLTSQAHADHPAAALAAACGVPVVAMAWPTGVRDVVENGTTGRLVRPRSVSAMAGGLLELAGEAGLAMGEQARPAAERFGARAVAAAWSAALEQAAGGGRSSRLARVRTVAGPPPATVRPAGSTAALSDLVPVLSSCDPDWFALRADSLVAVLPTRCRADFLERLRAIPALAGTPVQPDARDAARVAPGQLGSDVPVSHLRLWLAEGPVDVDFWDELDGEWHAPYPHDLVRIVPRDAPRTGLTVGDVVLPTVVPFDRPTFRDRPFPIDVVYTWVDGTDKTWLARREARLAEHDRDGRGEDGPDRTATGAARFASRDELRYSLRSLRRFAPWVRDIYLVTDGQRPAWLRADQQSVRVVDHTEILPAAALPTFNSQAIETALHRIDGLAEHFIYFNDDVLLGAPMSPSDFFGPGGSPRVWLSPGVVGVRRDGLSQYQRAHLNNRDLVLGDLDLVTVNVLQHTPFALRRSLLSDVEDRYHDAVHRTRNAPVRSPADVTLVSSLVQHVALATGRADEAEVSHRYVDLGSAQLERTLRTLGRRQDVATICLGDAHDLALGAERVALLVAQFLAEYYPDPAPWEKVS